MGWKVKGQKDRLRIDFGGVCRPTVMGVSGHTVSECRQLALLIR